MKQIRKRLTYANVMSSIAVFLVLGGAAIAATQLPKNSVGTKQLKNNAVTGPKVKNGSLEAVDFKAGHLPAGPRGERGEPGPAGPFPASLPSGKTIVGVFDVEGHATAANDLVTGDISYIYSAPGQHVVYVHSGTTDPNCTGTADTPTAPASYTCIYEMLGNNVGGHGINFQKNTGVGLYAFSAGGGNYAIDGTWAATGA